MRKAGVTAVALFGGLLLAAAASAEKGDPLDCKCESDVNEDGYDIHYFPLDGSGSRAYSCGSTGCHISIAGAFCSAGHVGCTGVNLETGDPGRRESEGVIRPNVVHLAYRSDVVYNAKRQALQMIGCNGKWIANVPITDEERDMFVSIQLAISV